MTLRACPACGGRLAAAGVEEASVTELPAAVRPQVRRFRVAVCRCTVCGRRGRGQQPELAPNHYGATAQRVGGAPAHLMTFETRAVTVYQIRDRHRNEEVREVVPADYEGVLVTDRGRSYDAIELAGVRQQKCLAHIQRSLSEVLERQQGKARAFGTRLKGWFRQALELWHDYHRGNRAEFTAQAAQLKDEIRHHLRDRPLKDPDNQRLLNELGWHNDRGNLLRFLDDPRLEPTNNRAEVRFVGQKPNL